MWSAYNDMRAANCRNCDKYFHCIGNYNAVHQCSGILQETTARHISNLREWRGGSDSKADQEANKFGRGGGDCARRYLLIANCAYNPSTRRCGYSG